MHEATKGEKKQETAQPAAVAAPAKEEAKKETAAAKK